MGESLTLVRTCRSTRRIQGWLAVRNSRFQVLIVSIFYSVLPPVTVLRMLSTFLCLDFNEKSVTCNDSLPPTLCPSGIRAQIVNSLTTSPTDDIKNGELRPSLALLSYLAVEPQLPRSAPDLHGGAFMMSRTRILTKLKFVRCSGILMILIVIGHRPWIRHNHLYYRYFQFQLKSDFRMVTPLVTDIMQGYDLNREHLDNVKFRLHQLGRRRPAKSVWQLSLWWVSLNLFCCIFSTRISGTLVSWTDEQPTLLRPAEHFRHEPGSATWTVLPAAVKSISPSSSDSDPLETCGTAPKRHQFGLD